MIFERLTTPVIHGRPFVVLPTLDALLVIGKSTNHGTRDVSADCKQTLKKKRMIDLIIINLTATSDDVCIKRFVE